MISIIRKAAGFFKTLHRGINYIQFAVPAPVLYFLAMFLFSLLIMILETMYFHLLLIVTSYIKATFIISITMLGIAFGSFIGFYLNKVKLHAVLITASLLTIVSIVLSYYNIINIGTLKYPYLLILPFIFASIIISIIFARGHSNKIYFTNLFASAAGVVASIFIVQWYKSENALILMMLVPAGFIGICALSIRDNIVKTAALVLSVVLCFYITGIFQKNIQVPEKIDKTVFQSKILSELGTGFETDYFKNYVTAFFTKVYVKDPASNSYKFSGDAYDKKRADYFLSVLGMKKRFGMGYIPYIEKKTVLENTNVISADVYEKEILPALKRQYSHKFGVNEDKKFIDRVYKLNPAGDSYVLSGDSYDRLRAKYLLSQLGHFEMFDLNFDVRPHVSLREIDKWFGTDLRVLLSEDGMLGRIEYLVDEKATVMSVNGNALDTMSYSSGPFWDPRMPHIKDPKVFIVGLSADGVAKSATILPNSKVSGIEINPTILRTMQEDGQFSRRANYPYKGIDVHDGEGRSYLENTKEKYDIITLMNIHAEHGPICTLAPEFFHTVEGTQLLLNKLTDRGVVTYEEIITNERSKLFLLKFLNTVKTAMKGMGIAEPEKNIHIFSWDFYEGGRAFHTVTLKRVPFTPAELAYLNGEYLSQIKDKPYYYSVTLDYSPGQKTGRELERIITGGPEFKLTWVPNYIPADVFEGSILAKLKNKNDADFLVKTFVHQKESRYYTQPSAFPEETRQKVKGILQTVGYPNAPDLSPATDDKPFPYDVYNVKKEIWDILSLVMKFSLVLFIPILLALVFSFKKVAKPLSWQFFFAASTGFGYMLVEIVLMQKFQRFIGSPTYSLILILGGLLLFSGIGSFLSGYLSKKWQTISVAFIPVLLLFYAFFLDGIFLRLAEFGFNGKLVASSLLILPISFLMGVPFPNALEKIKKLTSPEYGSMLFGISGAFATLASTSALLFTVTLGFTATYFIGIACYALGAALFAIIIRQK